MYNSQFELRFLKKWCNLTIVSPNWCASIVALFGSRPSFNAHRSLHDVDFLILGSVSSLLHVTSRCLPQCVIVVARYIPLPATVCHRWMCLQLFRTIALAARTRHFSFCIQMTEIWGFDTKYFVTRKKNS